MSILLECTQGHVLHQIGSFGLPTAEKTIEKIYQEQSSKYNFAFANGGDQNNESIPESTICKKLGIELIDGL